MKKASLHIFVGMLAVLALMLAGCGNPAMSRKGIGLRDTAATIEIVSSKALPGSYAKEDIKHLFLKAFQVDASGAYHVLPNLTRNTSTKLYDNGNLTEFPKTGVDTYSGSLLLNPDNIGVRFVVWAVSYNDYTYVVAEREATERQDQAKAAREAAVLALEDTRSVVETAESDIQAAAAAGEASGYRVLYHVQADRNWTAMNAFNMTMMEGTFEDGETGPAGGVIFKYYEPADYSHPDALDQVDVYFEAAPRDCPIVMSWDDAGAAAASDHINGFTDWQAPSFFNLWDMMKDIKKDMALFANGEKYWSSTSWDDLTGQALSFDYPSSELSDYDTNPRGEKLRLRAARCTISAVGFGKGIPRRY